MASFTSSHPLDAPGSAPRVIVEALTHRGELAALELREAQQHGFCTAVIMAFAAGLVLLAGFAATIAVAAAVWDRPNRGAILGWVALGDLAVAGLLALVASRRLKTWQPFAETTRQFHEDCACIHDVIASCAR